MFGSLGITELLIILFIIIILFGAKRLPELARGLGQGINEFKKASRTDGSDENADSHRANTTPNNEQK